MKDYFENNVRKGLNYFFVCDIFKCGAFGFTRGDFMSSRNSMDLTKGPIFKQLIVFSFPVILSSILQQFYNTADQIVVGRFSGEDALAAVGATSYVITLFVGLFSGLSVGATVVCAKYCGAGDAERTAKTVHSSIAIAVVGGLMGAFLGIVFSSPILNLIGVPDDISSQANAYMRIMLASFPFSLVYNFGAGILRARGDTKRPLYILFLTGFLNVLMNLWFVIAFKLGAIGVGLATAFSNVMSAFLVIMILVRSDDVIKLDLKKIRLHRTESVEILRIGIPAGFSTSLYSITNIFLQSTVNTFGTVYIAASSVVSNVTAYVNLITGAVGTAVVSFVGQNHGAKNYRRIRSVIKVSLVVSLISSAIMAGIAVAFSKQILGIYTDDSAVVEAGVGKLVIMAISFLLSGATGIYGSVLRGVEKPNICFVINILSICAVRIIWIGLIFPLYPIFEMVFFCYPLSWTVQIAVLGPISYKMLSKLERENENEEIVDVGESNGR